MPLLHCLGADAARVPLNNSAPVGGGERGFQTPPPPQDPPTQRLPPLSEYGTLWLSGKCISGLAQYCYPLFRDPPTHPISGTLDVAFVAIPDPRLVGAVPARKPLCALCVVAGI